MERPFFCESCPLLSWRSPEPPLGTPFPPPAADAGAREPAAAQDADAGSGTPCGTGSGGAACPGPRTCTCAGTSSSARSACSTGPAPSGSGSDDSNGGGGTRVGGARGCGGGQRRQGRAGVSALHPPLDLAVSAHLLTHGGPVMQGQVGTDWAQTGKEGQPELTRLAAG